MSITTTHIDIGKLYFLKLYKSKSYRSEIGIWYIMLTNKYIYPRALLYNVLNKYAIHIHPWLKLNR